MHSIGMVTLPEEVRSIAPLTVKVFEWSRLSHHDGDASSERCRRSKNHCGLARQDAAITVRQREVCIPDLPAIRFAAQLADAFDKQKQAIHSWVDAGQAAAIGIHRQSPARGNGAVFDEAADPMLIYDDYSHYLDANRAALTMSGTRLRSSSSLEIPYMVNAARFASR